MRGPRPAACIFPDRFVQDAMQTVRRRTALMQEVQRCRLVLLLHERPTISHEEAARVVGLSARQVQRWRVRWASGDFSIEDYTGRGRKPAFSPGGSRTRHRHGLRNGSGNQTAAQPTIGRGSDWPGAKGIGPTDQPQHGVAHAA